ncbi:eukaryotic translation initiation factor [Sporothrix brasiliensis 5110]|uniref:Eukaryotic translation initiation factor n=1 Tax=Sporothrix brasiliensis 5110 TaxID=1398154 RepID=A0A0C2IVQ9_9PEZI|nr:eukaryotic translation initiation factor [Sporothrix brasiliensis 5110]KIH89067.1 eukaryotic translation initiation factor [Sporothrix brasiliensis 5110]
MTGRPPQQGGPPPGGQRRLSQGSQSGGPPRGMAHQRGTSQSSQQGRPPNLDVSQQIPSGSPGPSSPRGPPNPFGPGLGFDPARNKIEEAKRREKEVPNRMDLPPEAYSMARLFPDGKKPLFAARPGYNEKDKPLNIRVNQYRVEQTNSVTVYQYAVSLVPEPPKAIVYKKCWASHAVQKQLERQPQPGPVKIAIDLDAEAGKTTRPGHPNQYIMLIRQTSAIYLDSLMSYLRGKSGWDTHILECMNFFDHALRQKPSQSMTAIRRNFYHPQSPKRDLDGTIYAAKGIYAAFRLSESVRTGGSGLGINVDVANTTFWKDQTLDKLVMNLINISSDKWNVRTATEAAQLLRPIQWHLNTKLKEPTMSDAFKVMRRLHKLRFKVFHRGKTNDSKIYTIARFAWHQRFMFEGATSETYTFTLRKTGETRTVYDHYLKQYDVPLQYPKYPVIETTRDGAFPLEVCHILPWQRYNFKLNGQQTSDMIKFAVTRPAERAKSIMENVKRLGWDSDEYLREFGIRVNPDMSKVQARLLKPPVVSYKNGNATPGTSGRWDLRSKLFYINNKGRELRSWGVAVVDNCMDFPAVQNFIRVFTKTFKDHGGLVEKKPHLAKFPRGKDLGDAYQEAYDATTNVNGGEDPVIMFWILPSKNSFPYYRLKKNGECRYGMVSQMLNAAHVAKAQPQYCSNVSMKVNAKLGGTTCRVPAEGGSPSAPAFFNQPTMIIGLDVSHGSTNMKGELEPSMAAMAVSWDKDAAKYSAFCQTNGYRQEIVNPVRMNSMFDKALRKWTETLNCKMPAHVFYFRDGVSEGQFIQVMDFEVAQLKEIFQKRCGRVPKFTVIVATKRHHIRFFPEPSSADRNGNPLPGTLVEKEVTHPFHYDFYLCSHTAIQGTARPVHYHVIHDEVKMPPHLLQKMIYQQCYQYARSTTPVSLHPAVYYAHIAGDRARAHENVESDRKDPELIKKSVENWTAKKSSGSITHPTESLPLLPFGAKESHEKNRNFTPWTMWFI